MKPILTILTNTNLLDGIALGTALPAWGFHQSRPGMWTLADKDYHLTITVHNNGANQWVRAEWSDGRFSDVTYFDAPADTHDILFWVKWYLSGGRLTEQGTIGYFQNVPQAA